MANQMLKVIFLFLCGVIIAGLLLIFFSDFLVAS